MAFNLRAERGPFAGRVFPIHGSVSMGRQEGNGITLADDQLSRRHARFDEGPGGLSVADLGSANGVFVNGQRIAGTTPLHPGDAVELGSSVLRVELAAGAQPSDDATRAAAPPRAPGWAQQAAAPAPAWAQPGSAAASSSSPAGFPPGSVPATPAPAARRSSLPVALLAGAGVLLLCVCIAVAGILAVASRGGDSTSAGSGGGSSSSSGGAASGDGSGAGATAPSFGSGGGSGGASGGSSGSTGSGGSTGGSAGGSSGGASGGGNTSSRPQAGVIAGQITTAEGRPLPAGATGKVRISGNTIGGQAATYEATTDPQGRYSQRVTDGIYSIVARVTFTHNGGVFNLLLHPNDERGATQAYESRNGVVKDFTWRLSGLTSRDAAPDNADNYYGQVANVVPNTVQIPPGSTLELTFTPSGPLADGSRGQTITRTVQGAASITQAQVFDLPLGPYSVTARIIGPQARAVSVCVSKNSATCLNNPRGFAAQAAADWTVGQTGLVAVPIYVTLGE